MSTGLLDAACPLGASSDGTVGEALHQACTPALAGVRAALGPRAPAGAGAPAFDSEAAERHVDLRIALRAQPIGERDLTGRC